MRIILAPMEGVIDYEMRDVLTSLGGYDRCVTEFIRVNQQILPNRVFQRFSPELNRGGLTPSGVPVYIQLLGSCPNYMALNATKLQNLEPPGIDLNFGCPSKKVNKNDGGSALLREPKRIGEIVSSVRDAVDSNIPVTAKIRLGYGDHDSLEEISENIVMAGATELCIHARTREDRYKAPAYWSAVKKIAKKITIPLIINGEIWSVKDAEQARQQSGCEDIMLGRSALSFPDLAMSIKAKDDESNYRKMEWDEVLSMVVNYLQQSQNKHPLFVSNRTKQWLVFLQRHYPEAVELFHRVKRLKSASDVFQAINLTFVTN